MYGKPANEAGVKMWPDAMDMSEAAVLGGQLGDGCGPCGCRGGPGCGALYGSGAGSAVPPGAGARAGGVLVSEAGVYAIDMSEGAALGGQYGEG